MRKVNIDRLTLSSLEALEALLRERSVSRAAQRAGMSQPTMSHMLARLRRAFGDPLLVRSRKGSALTAYGERLLARIPYLIQELQLLRRDERFSPAGERGMYRIACTDHASMVLLPGIEAMFSAAAPDATLKILSVHSRRVDLEHLEAAHFDVLVGYFEALPTNWHVKRLFEERLVIIASADSDFGRRDLDLETFLAAKHIVLAADERTTHNRADRFLAARGCHRNARMFVSNFSTMPFVVANSDMIALVPATLAKRFLQLPTIRVVEPPLKLPRFTISMAWHPRAHQDPAGRWIRQLIVDAADKA
jgi:DNA-binding transcriptional LysR family regulator